jgi:chaperonin GroEL
VINQLRGTLKVCAIKAPGFGDDRKGVLQDLAILTNATFVSDEMGMSLDKADISVLGEIQKVVIKKETTTLVGGKADPEALKNRILQLEAECQACTSTYDKEKIEMRRAKLLGGVAVIYVGATTEPEMRQKKQLFEDSLSSTKAALEEGIVPGGGITLLAAAKAALKLGLTGDELTGAEIVIKACEAPFRQIVSNCGLDPSTLLEQALAKGIPFGFNARTGKIEDLLAAGVIDAKKVATHALTYAVGAAGMVLLTEVLIGNLE